MPTIRKKVLGPQHEAAAKKIADLGKTPLWKGPEVDGITFSMLNRFLTCRERFRIAYVEGWKTQDEFNHRIEYGNMWHVCEEAAAQEVQHFKGELSGIDTTNWEDMLRSYVKGLCAKYPTQQEQVVHWYNVCRVQFPLYVRHWSKHTDMTNRTPLLQEQVFDVPYLLPSGRAVRLRGKWDSVDLVKNGEQSGIWIQENKTKGDIDVAALQRQMTMDLQSMIYMVALEEDQNTTMGYLGAVQDQSTGRLARDRNNKEMKTLPIVGIRYNVVRRPLSGGKGSITQGKGTKGAKCPKCKGSGKAAVEVWSDTGKCEKCSGVGRINAQPAESNADFYARLGQVIESASGPEWGVHPDENYFFTRFNVGVSQSDITQFKVRVLSPLLEQVCDWYEWVTWSPKIWEPNVSYRGEPDYRQGYGLHWQHPFGVVNAVDEYGQTDVDGYMRTGSTVGLQRREKLFEELT